MFTRTLGTGSLEVALLAVVLGTTVLAAFSPNRPAADPDREWLEVEPTPPEVTGLMTLAEIKRGLAEEVVAGRLSLAEAAAAFYRANGERNALLFDHAGDWGGTREEKLCRQVIAYVRSTDERSEAAVARLETELAGWVAAGPLSLPGVPSLGTEE